MHERQRVPKLFIFEKMTPEKQTELLIQDLEKRGRWTKWKHIVVARQRKTNIQSIP